MSGAVRTEALAWVQALLDGMRSSDLQVLQVPFGHLCTGLLSASVPVGGI